MEDLAKIENKIDLNITVYIILMTNCVYLSGFFLCAYVCEHVRPNEFYHSFQTLIIKAMLNTAFA